MEGMAQFPDKYFDLAIVDPPYGINITKNGNIGFGNCYDHRNGKKINAQRREWTKKDWDNKSPNIEYFNQLLRISKEQIIWGINYYNGLVDKFSSGRIIWEKNPSLKNRYELAGISLIKNIVLFQFFWDGILQGKSSNEGYLRQGNIKLYEKRIHPTQKPIALYKWLLKNYAKPEFKIIDTHAGSCSSVIAFLEFGCQWIAFEIDKDYYEAASKRIDIYKRQLKINFEAAS